MSTEPVAPKGQEMSMDIPRRGRSSQYPAMNLEKAVDLARKVWNTQRKQEAHVDATLRAMGYTSQSGASTRALSGLKQYGLTQDVGEGNSKRVKLSEIGMNVLLPDSDPRKEIALRGAALSPAINHALWERYGKMLPDDKQIIPFLTHDKNYHDDAAADIIQNYRSTFVLANLDKMESDDSNDDPDSSLQPKGVGPSIRENSIPRTPNTMHEMPVPIGPSMVARIPFPMTEDDYDFLLEALKLYKKKLVPASQPSQKPRIGEESI
jgi:hypothetical protein